MDHPKLTKTKSQEWPAIVSAALLAAIAANASDIVWIGGTGLWDVATNWSRTQVPGATDYVFVTNDGTCTVILDKSDVDPAVAGNLTLGGAKRTDRPGHRHCGRHAAPG